LKEHKLIVTSYHHSVINKKEPTVFRTVSHYEYNDPHLRYLIAKYASKVEGNPDVASSIMTNQTEWARVIRRYKNVGMHFLVCKLEVWFIVFLHPVLKLEHATGSNAFGSSHGAIHSHILLYTNSNTDKPINDLMGDWVIAAMDASVIHDGVTSVSKSCAEHLSLEALAAIELTFRDALATSQSIAFDRFAVVLTKDTGVSA
jgi:hypothetical protein